MPVPPVRKVFRPITIIRLTFRSITPIRGVEFTRPICSLKTDSPRSGSKSSGQGLAVRAQWRPSNSNCRRGQTKQEYQTFYDGFGPGWGWRGWGGMDETPATVENVLVGSLVIDMYDGSSHHLSRNFLSGRGRGDLESQFGCPFLEKLNLSVTESLLEQ